MDIKKLSNLDVSDLKNIDLSNVKTHLMNSLDIIIILALIAITAFVSWGFFGNYTNKANELIKTIEEQKEKLDSVKNLELVEKNYAEFLSSFPKEISKEKLNKELSSYAINNQVQILSLAPKAIKEYEHYITKEFQVRLSSDTYKKIIKFVRDIEKSPYALRIVKWSAGNVLGMSAASYFSNSETANEDEIRSIEVKISLESIELRK